MPLRTRVDLKVSSLSLYLEEAIVAPSLKEFEQTKSSITQFDNHGVSTIGNRSFFLFLFPLRISFDYSSIDFTLSNLPSHGGRSSIYRRNHVITIPQWWNVISGVSSGPLSPFCPTRTSFFKQCVGDGVFCAGLRRDDALGVDTNDEIALSRPTSYY